MFKATPATHSACSSASTQNTAAHWQWLRAAFLSREPRLVLHSPSFLSPAPGGRMPLKGSYLQRCQPRASENSAAGTIDNQQEIQFNEKLAVSDVEVFPSVIFTSLLCALLIAFRFLSFLAIL